MGRSVLCPYMCVNVFLPKMCVGSMSSCVLQCSSLFSTVFSLFFFFLLGNPIVPLFCSLAAVLCCFKSICWWQICDFCKVVLFSGLACLITPPPTLPIHFPPARFFSLHSPSFALSPHFICLCNIMNGCILHLDIAGTELRINLFACLQNKQNALSTHHVNVALKRIHSEFTTIAYVTPRILDALG